MNKPDLSSLPLVPRLREIFILMVKQIILKLCSPVMSQNILGEGTGNTGDILHL